MNSDFIIETKVSSFMTESTLFLVIMRALAISFMAYSSPLSLLETTRQTLPNPPLPTAYCIVKLDFYIWGTLSLSLEVLKLQFPMLN